MCDSVQDWLREECNGYRSMHVLRPQTWSGLQGHVDPLVDAFGTGEGLKEVVQVGQVEGSEQAIRAELRATAGKLAGRAMGLGLPSDISRQIELDVAEVGSLVARLLPAAEELIVKLQLFGEASCCRWHQDWYQCRAIITYNGPGTEYQDMDNVNMWELEYCGNNDHIIRDKSRVHSTSAGDILFMKGRLFPGAVNGLVHKSPEKRYHSDGKVLNRLVLKLDVV